MDMELLTLTMKDTHAALTGHPANITQAVIISYRCHCLGQVMKIHAAILVKEYKFCLAKTGG